MSKALITFRITTALFGVTFGSCVHGQTMLIPDSRSVWHTHFWDSWSYDWAATYYLTDELTDTLINDTTFVVLMGYGNWSSWPGSFCGGLYENGLGQAYYYHPNSESTNLLMDFDVLPGDSIVNVSIGSAFDSSPTLRTVYVVQVDTVLIGGHLRKAVGIVGAHPDLVGYDPIHWWIEGIGGTGGLLETSGLIALDISGGLECMSHNDSILWQFGPAGYPGSCLSVGINDPSSVQPPWFHPTVADEALFIDGFPGFSGAVEILATDGRLLMRHSGILSTVNISTLTPGTYLLRVLNPDKPARCGRFIKQ